MPNNKNDYRLIIGLIIKIKQATKFILNQAFDFIIGPLVVVGSILCIMFFEPWPLKFVSMATWLLFLYFLSKAIDRLKRRE